MTIVGPVGPKIFKIWRTFLVFVFVYSIYHFIRDILQDILGIHNAFTEFMHYQLKADNLPSYLSWLAFGGYRKWITFPVEIFLIISIPRVIKKEDFTFLERMIFLGIMLFSLVWLIGFFYRSQ